MDGSGNKPGVARAVLGIGALLAIWALVSWGTEFADRFFNPWAYGPRALVGTWVGRLTTGGGHPRAVFLEMHQYRPKPTRRSRAYCGKSCGTFAGGAATCDEHGLVRRYKLGGSPLDRRATEIRLGTSAPDSMPDGLSLSTMRGRWLTDSLALEATFSIKEGNARSTSTGNPDTRAPVPLGMHRGSESDFRTLCATIATR